MPAKARYSGKDLQDWARVAGLKIKMPPSVFPVNSVKAMRMCLVLAPQGKLVPFATAVFEAYWGDDADISQDAVLRAVCDRAGLGRDADALLAAQAGPAIKDQLRANTDEVMAPRRLWLADHLRRRVRHVLRQRPPPAGPRRAGAGEGDSLKRVCAATRGRVRG